VPVRMATYVYIIVYTLHIHAAGCAAVVYISARAPDRQLIIAVVGSNSERKSGHVLAAMAA
jgi:hypothetical protein